MANHMVLSSGSYLISNSVCINQLFSGMSESKGGEINLQEISKSSLSTILKYIYTGNITISNNNAQDLAEAAGFMQFLEIQEACFKFLEVQLNLSNSREVEHVGERLFGRQLSEHARQFTAEKFMDIVASPEFSNFTKVGNGKIQVS